MKRMCDMFTNDFFLDEKDFDKDLDIVINNVGFSRNSAGYTYGYDWREYYILHYIISGQGIYKVNDCTYHLHAKDGFLVPARTTVIYQADEAEPWSVYWVGFRGRKADYFLSRMNLSAENPVFHFDKDDSLITHMESMFKEVRYPQRAQEVLLGHFYQAAACIINYNKDSPNPVSQNYVTIATRFIEHNFRIPLRVQDLAEECNISASQLYRCFIKELGISPHQYIEKLKMEKAVEFITQTDMPYKEIAYLLGYEYESHFFKVFKRTLRKSPSCFRK